MGKYASVDCGKYNTKCAYYDPVTGKPGKFKFRTKMSPGTFDDDMFGKNTFIVQVDDGEVMKIGNEAKQEPELETSKKSEIHRICTLAAFAMEAGESTTEPINAVIGIPLQICDITEERLSYKNFIYGGESEQHTVRIKMSCDGPVREINFSFGKRFVYPEGIGVLYEFPSRLDGATAILDIGNLNTNNLYCNHFLVNYESCFSTELGGKPLISSLSQVLTAELGSRCDDNLTASLLLKPYESRFLVPVNGNKEIQERSRAIVDRHLMEHVQQIKRMCDTRHWPLDFMNVVCIGGTAKLLTREIKAVFGENAFIPDCPEFVNANGFLKRLLATDGIDMTAGENK